LKGMITSIITLAFFLALFGALVLEMQSKELRIRNKGDALIVYRLSQDFREVGFNIRRIIGINANVTRENGKVILNISDFFENIDFSAGILNFEDFVMNKSIGNKIFDITFGTTPNSTESIIIEPYGIYYGYGNYAKYNISIYKPDANIAANITYYELIINVPYYVNASASSATLYNCTTLEESELCRPIYINVTGTDGSYFSVADKLFTDETSIMHVVFNDTSTYINITFGKDTSNNNGTLVIVYSDDDIKADLNFRFDLNATNVREPVRLVFNQDVIVSNKLFEIEKRDKVVLTEG